MIVALPLAIIGWLTLLDRANERYSLMVSLCLACGLIMCLLLVIGAEPTNDSFLRYIHGARPLTLSENAFIYTSVSERGRINVVSRSGDVIFYTPNDISRNIIGSNILRSIQHVDGCDNGIFTALLNDNQTNLFDTVKGCPATPLSIATNQGSYNQLLKAVGSRQLGDRVNILPLY